MCQKSQGDITVYRFNQSKDCIQTEIKKILQKKIFMVFREIDPQLHRFSHWIIKRACAKNLKVLLLLIDLTKANIEEIL